MKPNPSNSYLTKCVEIATSTAFLPIIHSDDKNFFSKIDLTTKQKLKEFLRTRNVHAQVSLKLMFFFQRVLVIVNLN